jgi:MoaA/NifB/PqqE/SkfB family radical SAM enzyme
MRGANTTKKYDTLILNLHDIGCKNHCVFCASAEYLNQKIADQIAKEELKKLNCLKQNKNIQSIIISGNDPIEYYNFIDFLKRIKKITNIGIFLQSHCVNFEDINYLKKVLEVGNVKFIQIPLYGHTAQIHDSITQNKGSFNSVMKAINNLKKLGFDGIKLHTLFLKQNEKYLFKHFSFLLKFGYPIDASLPCIPSYQDRYSPKLIKNIPDLKKVFNFLKNIKKCGKNFDKIFIYDIPLCLAPGISNVSFSTGLPHKGYEHFKNIKIDKKYINKEIMPFYRILVKGPECSRCILDNKCKGITKPYLDLGLFQPKPFLASNRKSTSVCVKNARTSKNAMACIPILPKFVRD